jgi:hypothetical protein
MSVRNVGVPVIVTAALSKTRPANACFTASEAVESSSSGALPTTSAAKIACLASGMNARSGLRTTSASSAGVTRCPAASIEKPSLPKSRNLTQPALFMFGVPAAPTRIAVTAASVRRSATDAGS